MDMRTASTNVLAKFQASQPTPQMNPAIIAIIIEMIQTLLPLILEQCNKPPSAVPHMAASALKIEGFEGLVWRMTARRCCIRELGRRPFIESGGDALLNAVLCVAADSTPAEIGLLYSSMTVYRGE